MKARPILNLGEKRAARTEVNHRLHKILLLLTGFRLRIPTLILQVPLGVAMTSHKTSPENLLQFFLAELHWSLNVLGKAHQNGNILDASLLLLREGFKTLDKVPEYPFNFLILHL